MQLHELTRGPTSVRTKLQPQLVVALAMNSELGCNDAKPMADVLMHVQPVEDALRVKCRGGFAKRNVLVKNGARFFDAVMLMGKHTPCIGSLDSMRCASAGLKACTRAGDIDKIAAVADHATACLPESPD